MRIVAVDTTTPRGSVALLEEGEVKAEVRVVAADSHSRWLAGAVAFVVEAVGCSPGEVEGWAVASGPGSFTGLRVGISTVQGLALASSRPCTAVSSLDALAVLAGGVAGTIVPLVDAFRDEVYWAVYDGEGRPAGEPRVGPVESLALPPPGPLAFVGDGATRFRERLLALRPDAIFPPVEPWLAATLARLGEARIAAGEGADPGALRPVYVRGADIRKAP